MRIQYLSTSTQKKVVGIAALDNAESRIDDKWGEGAKAPILVGPSQSEAKGKSVSASKLVELGAGNAKLMWPKHELDGPASSFGKRFWDFLSTNAPLEIGALKTVGVRSIQYDDRYLLQPYTLSLLSQVILNTPKAKEASIRIQTAYDDRLNMDARFLHQSFKSDATRQQVLEKIFPTANISIRPKGDLPHFRKLQIELLDRRQIEIFLDQGMGAWRVNGSKRHDFGAPVKAQADMLVNCKFSVNSEGPAVPVALTTK